MRHKYKIVCKAMQPSSQNVVGCGKTLARAELNGGVVLENRASWTFRKTPSDGLLRPLLLCECGNVVWAGEYSFTIIAGDEDE